MKYQKPNIILPKSLKRKDQMLLINEATTLSKSLFSLSFSSSSSSQGSKQTEFSKPALSVTSRWLRNGLNCWPNIDTVSRPHPAVYHRQSRCLSWLTKRACVYLYCKRQVRGRKYAVAYVSRLGFHHDWVRVYCFFIHLWVERTEAKDKEGNKSWSSR